MRRPSKKILAGVVLAGIILVTLILALPLGGTSPGLKGGHEDYCVDFCTQSHYSWGLECGDENTGCLRDNNWDKVTGGTLVVGEGHTLTFTSSEAVAAFLPTDGPARSLTGEHINPTVTESGILGGQVTALKLNVLFSDEGIGKVEPACDGLRNMRIIKGPFSKMEVGDFLTLAEEVLGGDLTHLPSGVTLSDVNDTAASINENFGDCKTDNKYIETSKSESSIEQIGPP
ncbi:MAG: hypothetical protein HQ553_08625 [Chloroflexi bacterium]|nr:hypothetical protein [Chloroflexota bacterium]